jgi:hypothetical protein
MADTEETEFKVSGDLQENYKGLHASTHESYASIADRVQKSGGHKALVGWLKQQKDTHTLEQVEKREAGHKRAAARPAAPASPSPDDKRTA